MLCSLYISANSTDAITYITKKFLLVDTLAYIAFSNIYRPPPGKPAVHIHTVACFQTLVATFKAREVLPKVPSSLGAATTTCRTESTPTHQRAVRAPVEHLTISSITCERAPWLGGKGR